MNVESTGIASPVSRPGVSAELLAKAGVRNVEPAEAQTLVGYSSAGIIIPYRTLSGEPLSFDGRPVYRLRLRNPNGSAKYLSPRGAGCQLYCPPGLRSLLLPGCAVGVVEGEFKAMALVEAGFPCVGIGGISAACPKNDSGSPELLPALAELIAEARPSRVYFIGDSDTALIADFSREAVKLKNLIDVPVFLPRIPLDAPGKGPDDLRAAWANEFRARWQEILDAAESVTEGTTRTALVVRLLRREYKALLGLTGEGLDKATEKIVKLAAAIHNDALASDAVEQVANQALRIRKPVFRSAVKARLQEKRQRLSERVAANNLPLPGPALNGGKTTHAFDTPPITGDKILILPSGEVSILEAANDIFREIARHREMFYRGRRVHEVAKNKNDIVLSVVTPAQFRSRIESYGAVMAWRAHESGGFVLKIARCSNDTSGALLDSLPARDHLLPVRALSPVPILANTEEGCDVLCRGWHDFNGGLYVTGGEVAPVIEFDTATKALLDLLQDFEFLTPSDHARAAAALITPALRMGRWLEQRAPIDVAEADSSQAGKGFRHKLTAAIYRQRPRIVAQKSGGVGSLEESLAEALVEGHSFITIDNVRGRINSPFLEAVLTAPGEVGCRTPFKGTIGVDPSLVNFQLSSNGAEMTTDLANRSSVIRIRKRPESYTFATYPEGDVYAHVQANQSFYLACVFTLILRWAEEGQPRNDERRHDFREWAGILDWFTRNVFKLGPLLDGHVEAKARLSDIKLSWVRTLLIELRNAGLGREAMGAAQLADFAVETGILPPNMQADADSEAVSKVIGSIMALVVFKNGDVADVDGFNLTRFYRYSERAGKKIPVYALS